MIKFETRKIPIVVAVALLVFGVIFFHNDAGVLGNIVLISMIVGVMPFVLLSYVEYHGIKSAEEQLPLFLRDLAESQKSGMNLPQALQIAVKTDYGVLSKEVKKMNDQLSWGIPLQEVLNRFSQRMHRSNLIGRAIRIINEAYSSGGNITDTMEATAVDVTLIKDAEKERRSLMTQHVTMMYAIYFIFLVIVLVLTKILLPMLQIGKETQGTFMAFQDPCSVCVGTSHLFCVSCSAFSLLCQMFGFGTGINCYYKALFFSVIIVQGLFTGLIAGQIGENSAIAGAKHSLIMTGSGFGIFMIALRLGII